MTPSALVLAAGWVYADDRLIGGLYGGSTVAIYGVVGVGVWLWLRGAREHRRQQARIESEFAARLADVREATAGCPDPSWLPRDGNVGGEALHPQRGYKGRHARDDAEQPVDSAGPDGARPRADFDKICGAMDTCHLPAVDL